MVPQQKDMGGRIGIVSLIKSSYPIDLQLVTSEGPKRVNRSERRVVYGAEGAGRWAR